MDEQHAPAGRLGVVVAADAPLPVGPPHLLEPPRGARPEGGEAAGGGEWVFGLTKSQAEDAPDWLEANGYPPGEVICREDGFAVRFPGFRAYRDPAGAIRLVP